MDGNPSVTVVHHLERCLSARAEDSVVSRLDRRKYMPIQLSTSLKSDDAAEGAESGQATSYFLQQKYLGKQTQSWELLAPPLSQSPARTSIARDSSPGGFLDSLQPCRQFETCGTDWGRKTHTCAHVRPARKSIISFTSIIPLQLADGEPSCHFQTTTCGYYVTGTEVSPGGPSMQVYSTGPL